MIIKDLKQMETIVNKNSKLAWDGWDVLEVTRSEKGRTSVSGKLINDKWHIIKRFTLNRQGWDLPDRLVKS